MKESNEITKVYIEKIFDVWKSKNDLESSSKNLQYSLNIVDQITNAFTAGSFYYFTFNFETQTINNVNGAVNDILGIALEDFTLTELLALNHPQDVSKMHEKEHAAFEFSAKKFSPKELLFYKLVYVMRLKDANGSYRKILHQAIPISVSDEGKIHQTICIHTDISYLNTPIDHKISFIGMHGRPSYHALDPSKFIFEEIKEDEKYTRQELKIIELISEGKSTDEIAGILHLSQHTIKTHRKNILKKSGASNTVQLIANCIREGII